MVKRAINNKGFSLTEILISLAVLGIIAAAGFESLQISHLLTRISSDNSLVTMLAETKMTELCVAKPKPGSLSGLFVEPYQDFSYKAEVRRIPKRYLCHIIVTVSGRKQHFVTESYFLTAVESEK